MNEAMKLENITSYMKELDIIPDRNFIYAQIDAKFWKYALFSGFAALSIQHFLLYFHADKLLLIGVTTLGDFGGKVSEVLRTDISDMQYKKGLLQGTLTIKLKSEDIVFKVPKVIAIAPWQKVNLEYLLQQEWG